LDASPPELIIDPKSIRVEKRVTTKILTTRWSGSHESRIARPGKNQRVAKLDWWLVKGIQNQAGPFPDGLVLDLMEIDLCSRLIFYSPYEQQ
jgi:hypothetical protein